MTKATFAVLVVFMMNAAQAQTGRYLIQLRDKAQNPYSTDHPEQFLSQRSIERRVRYNITYDSTDLPVTPAYIDSLRALSSITVLNVSKWLNQVSIQVTNTAVLDTINRYPFVQSTSLIANRMQRSNRAPGDKLFKNAQASDMQSLTTTEQAFDYGAATAQENIHNGAFLHNMGLQGQGMIISMLDAGFYHYTSLKAFDSVNQRGQVLGTWDFVTRDTSVVEDHQHGMECFSIIAANIPGTLVGTAPEASFFLFRSEDAATEYPIEEHNWVCAAERADSAGGDVISTSLGYSTFDNPALNHQYSDMNGNTTIAARGADFAAKKGLLVVVAAGNSGAGTWKYIVTPADADSVLTVGAVDTLGNVAAFSSYGPSADGRIKPDVASVGVNTALQGPGGNIISGGGTSFACPNMAGLATCLWQGFPEFNNMKIIDALRQSSSHYQTPDDRTGYGIPDMKKATQLLLNDFATDSVSDCKTINWTSKDVSAMRYEIERQKSGEAAFVKIAEQSGTDKTFQTHSYQFTDSSLTIADGLIRYRIRQVLDTSALGFTAFYIDTLSVSVALGCTPVPVSENGVQIIPNPVTTSFHLKIESAARNDLQFVIVNAIGQTVYTQRTSKPNGIRVFSIGTVGLAPGVYYLMVFDGGKRFATKPFVKL